MVWHKCHFERCAFKAKRSDQLKVHIDEVHEKKLKICKNCGKAMTSSSLSRHKRNNICANKNDPSLHAAHIVDEQKVKVSIETEVNVQFHSDGTVTVGHEGVNIGNLTLYLTTTKPCEFFFLKMVEDIIPKINVLLQHTQNRQFMSQ